MRALITGVLGQDGSYLAEQLLAQGHDVWGLTRRFNAKSPATLVVGDLLDQDSLEAALDLSKPEVVFNLAAVTAPGAGWGTPQPPLLADVTAVGVVRLLEAMVRVTPNAKLVHASSSAIYDARRYGLYGIAKQFAHNAVVGYRDRLQTFNAVLFSHTSPRQDPRFLSRRICDTIIRIRNGSDERLVLGDVESRRDWGFAPDYTKALTLIGEKAKTADWVICRGVTHSVRDFTETALKLSGLDWSDVVFVDRDAPRVPNEVHPEAVSARLLTGKALGWKAETSFDDMVAAML